MEVWAKFPDYSLKVESLPQQAPQVCGKALTDGVRTTDLPEENLLHSKSAALSVNQGSDVTKRIHSAFRTLLLLTSSTTIHGHH